MKPKLVNHISTSNAGAHRARQPTQTKASNSEENKSQESFPLRLCNLGLGSVLSLDTQLYQNQTQAYNCGGGGYVDTNK